MNTGKKLRCILLLAAMLLLLSGCRGSGVMEKTCRVVYSVFRSAVMDAVEASDDAASAVPPTEAPTATPAPVVTATPTEAPTATPAPTQPPMPPLVEDELPWVPA